jgi:hypothetical protein
VYPLGVTVHRVLGWIHRVTAPPSTLDTLTLTFTAVVGLVVAGKREGDASRRATGGPFSHNVSKGAVDDRLRAASAVAKWPSPPSSESSTEVLLLVVSTKVDTATVADTAPLSSTWEASPPSYPSTPSESITAVTVNWDGG